MVLLNYLNRTSHTSTSYVTIPTQANWVLWLDCCFRFIVTPNAVTVICTPTSVTNTFTLSISLRNAFLLNKGFPAPKATKTGTTIVGVVYKDGVVLGADTRATEDNIVATKNCQKIHYMAPNM